MELYIIAGPNGVGKTTFAHEFLPKYTDCTNFVNADLIARGIAPFSPDAAAFRAGRMMLDEMHAFAKTVCRLLLILLCLAVDICPSSDVARPKAMKSTSFFFRLRAWTSRSQE
jgi:hypothetical protein